MTATATDALVATLRDLSLVEPATLGDDPVLSAAHRALLHDVMNEARLARAELAKRLAGPDPLAMLDLPSARRASDQAREAMGRASDSLARRAEAARGAALLDDSLGFALARLLEFDRRLG